MTDSGLSATASLWATDVVKYSKREKEILEKQSLGQSITEEESKYLNKLDNKVIWQSRLSMIGVTVLALIIGYAAHFIAGFGVSQLFMISISVAASASVPTVLSLYWDKLSARGTFWGILIAIVVGMPLFIYANVIGNEVLIAVASLFMVTVSTIFCLAMPKRTIVQAKTE